MPFIARYKGRCAICHEGIVPGQEAEYDLDRNLMHVLCPENAEFDGTPRPVCPRCFMQYPRNGRCDCLE